MTAPGSRIVIVSDVHYASDAEKARGDHERHTVPNALIRFALHAYRRYFWRRDPYGHNYLLDRFITQAPDAALVVANGDYSCDTAFIGLSDPAAYESASVCIGALRRRFGERLRLTAGDHELGKMSMFGMAGGLRLASFARMRDGLGITPFWQERIEGVRLIGVTSSLIALPVYEPETLIEEREEWRRFREDHLRELLGVLRGLGSGEPWILFCHDPSALPYLIQEPDVRSRLAQLQATVIGHLHSQVLLWNSRVLSGMPVVEFLGNTVRRLSRALRDARQWEPFKVKLCPALAGIELAKDGGYLVMDLRNGRTPPRFELRRLRWERPVRQAPGPASA